MPFGRFLTACVLLLLSIGYVSAALPVQDSSGRPLPTLAPMLKKVNPAVVNISTYSTQQTYNPLLNDPFFRYFFNLPETRQAPQRRQQSAGSGVIVNAKKGTVITNYHVVKGADEVHVSMNDGREFEATVTGSDPDLDIAILDIEAQGLTAVKLADSSQLEVGDFVVAIGNPFGLGQTVTTGIVSALGRTGLGIEGYENFIQTDASINPGNSGGALVNLRGELVGINTAIIAPSGGNVGIGFAIPVNMAKSSMQQILRHGKVQRGQIGISTQDITSDLRAAFNLRNGQRGALITGVEKKSAAAAAGVQTGDVIIAVDGERTTSSGQLRSQLGVKPVGSKVTLEIIREGVARNIKVIVAKPKQLSASSGDLPAMLDGARFEDNTRGEGVVVTAVERNSVASYSGLRVGDVIVGANRKRVQNIDSFQKALKRSTRQILLHINRNGASLFLVIR